MIIQFLGAAQMVTGSMHLVESNGNRILLDCGLVQGKRAESRRLNTELPFDARTIDAVVLSHAHIDHSGNLPTLIKNGFDGSIFSTSATRDLCSVMLRDSAALQEADARTVSKLNAKNGMAPAEPMYSIQDAVRALRLFKTAEYGRSMEILPDTWLTFHDAGHILGSASVTLDVLEGDRSITLAFTGDVGRKNAAVVRDPDIIERADVLITESTYGGRHHCPVEQARERLAQVVNDTANKGGLLIIPAFAVGRTQEIVYDLHGLMEAEQIPSLPVYVDSPMATNVTEIFRLHPECYDEETHRTLMQDGDNDPFGFEMLKYIRSSQDSKRLNDLKEPAIIISASGMCEGGRVLQHLRHHIEDPRTTVLIVGFQAENTLGRKLLEGEKKVQILGEEHDVKAGIEVINAYSAHADEGELLEFIGAIPERPGQAFVVHGEPEAAQAMALGLRKLGIEKVNVPERGQKFQV